MSSDHSELAIRAVDLCKSYALNVQPARRLWQLITGRSDQADQHQALQGINLEVQKGQSVGIIGQNGAGKSTLLQLLCGTLTPSHGTLHLQGQIAALLELGAGFNPDFTGRENVLFSAALYGMRPEHIEAHMQAIIDFADIGEFIDQPVRTYSSGMYVRLAFSIATSVNPDVLVIDEALSVGDGLFARKSFDRIMQLRQAGVTLLFCSHSLFLVESLCTHCIWLHQGRVMAQGPSAAVIAQYNDWLSQQSQPVAPLATILPGPAGEASGSVPAAVPTGSARLLGVKARCNGLTGTALELVSGQSELVVDFEFVADPALPPPNLAVIVYGADGRDLCSAGSWIDGVTISRGADGRGHASLILPKLPLLKGRYSMNAFLMCERAVHVYEVAEHFVTLHVSQPHLEQGLFSIPHRWQSP